MAVPEVDAIDGLPPAVALQQQRGSPTTRSSVGSVTTLSNLLRMLYSRAGDYPPGQAIIYAEGFSPNTPEGACPKCHGLGRVYEVTEQSMVPDDSLTIRERAVAAWPTAWQGQNLRDILVTLGYDVDRPWRDLPKKDRDWILFTEEQPTVPVYAGLTPAEARRALKRKEEPSYMGTFTSARRHVLQTFANTRKRADEASRRAVHAEHRMSGVPRQAAAARIVVGDIRRARHRRHLAAAAQAPAGRCCGPIAREAQARPRHPSGRSSRSGSPRISSRASPRCSISASAISPSSAARRRCRPASCSGCGWRRRCDRICSAWSTCWTSRRRDCIRPTPRRCSRRSSG